MFSAILRWVGRTLAVRLRHGEARKLPRSASELGAGVRERSLPLFYEEPIQPFLDKISQVFSRSLNEEHLWRFLNNLQSFSSTYFFHKPRRLRTAAFIPEDETAHTAMLLRKAMAFKLGGEAEGFCLAKYSATQKGVQIEDPITRNYGGI
jgi:hypothetical protein